MTDIRAKITVIGDGRVGKTSLVKALCNLAFSNNEDSTHGIDIRNILLNGNKKSIKTAIWDFGGQEIYHSTFRLFLTKRSIYLLVIDSRHENNIQYWLNSTIAIVGYVPIIIVINKIDERYNSIPINQIKEQFPNVIDIKKTSCKTREGIKELEEVIVNSILEFNYFPNPPKNWMQVEEQLTQESIDHFEYSHFIKICESNNIIDKKEQNLISEYLNDLGVILRFKTMSLHNINIVSPEWITSLIYSIIDSNLIYDNKGIVSYNDIESILYEKYKLSEDKIFYVVNLMHEFELLIKLEDDIFVIPQFLPFQEPDFEFNYKDSLKFTFAFNFLPNDLFSRVLHRLKEYVVKNQIWRNGVSIKFNSGIGIIKKDTFTNKILLFIQGGEKKETLYLLRKTIINISESYEVIKFEEFIPIESKGEQVEIKYSYLLALREKKHEATFLPETLEEVSISSILSEVEINKKKEINPIQVFISYAQADIDYKVQLSKHVASLTKQNKITIWEKNMLLPGQVWEIETKDKLMNSDIILCLISSDYIDTEFCYSKEMDSLIEYHNKKLKTVLPIVIRPCFWDTLSIAKIKWIPRKAISISKNKDKKWMEVAKYIYKITNKMDKVKYSTQQSTKRQ